MFQRKDDPSCLLLSSLGCFFEILGPHHKLHDSLIATKLLNNNNNNNKERHCFYIGVLRLFTSPSHVCVNMGGKGILPILVGGLWDI